MQFQSTFKHFHPGLCISTCRLWNRGHFVSSSIGKYYVKQPRMCCITKCYFPVHIAGLTSSTVYTQDMCSDMSTISKALWLTSPGFLADFNGTGFCMCTAEPIQASRFTASVHVEHIILSDQTVCNASFDIFKIDAIKQNVVSECSPSQIKPRSYLFDTRRITVSFSRKIPINAKKKTVVWVAIHGKLKNISLISSLTSSQRRCPHYWLFESSGHKSREWEGLIFLL